MWADAQRDGLPAEYRWRPLFNTAVWLTPTAGVCTMVRRWGNFGDFFASCIFS